MKIAIINGPNINMLGIREPEVYGKESYKQLQESINFWAKELKIEASEFQSNIEGEIVDFIQKCYFEKYDGIVINPAAYTHTSIAILDALKATNLPAVEVHISDVNSREDFRHISFIKEYCIKTISGKGINGYKEALECLKQYLENK